MDSLEILDARLKNSSYKWHDLGKPLGYKAKGNVMIVTLDSNKILIAGGSGSYKYTQKAI